MRKIVLIACSKKKVTRRAKAQYLYNSDLFKKSLAFARNLKPNEIFILSAKHDLLNLDKSIEPYNETLNKMARRKRRLWSERVKRQMVGLIDFINDEVIFLAGNKYTEFLLPYFKKACVPLKGKKIGEQLKYLKDRTCCEK